MPLSATDLKKLYLHSHKFSAIRKLSPLKMLCWFVKKHRKNSIMIDELKMNNAALLKKTLMNLYLRGRPLTSSGEPPERSDEDGHLWIALTQWHFDEQGLDLPFKEDLQKLGVILPSLRLTLRSTGKITEARNMGGQRLRARTSNS